MYVGLVCLIGLSNCVFISSPLTESLFFLINVFKVYYSNMSVVSSTLLTIITINLV